MNVLNKNIMDNSEKSELSEIAVRFKAARIESGLTQAQLGEKLSVSQDTVSLWETGKSLPTAEYIIAICKLFSISADYLLGLTEY